MHCNLLDHFVKPNGQTVKCCLLPCRIILQRKKNDNSIMPLQTQCMVLTRQLHICYVKDRPLKGEGLPLQLSCTTKPVARSLNSASHTMTTDCSDVSVV
jgi:hypothetical protein